jgi:hypothetical protein
MGRVTGRQYRGKVLIVMDCPELVTRVRVDVAAVW